MKALTAAIAIAIVLLFLRIPLLDVPLERDEGEYAYIAREMDKGLVPYRDAFDQKPPAIFLIYWLSFLLFGQSAFSVHIALSVFIFAGAIFLFLLGRRLANPDVGVVAATTYGLLSSLMYLFGNAANTEQFMNVPIIAGLYLLLLGLDRDRPSLFFLSGLLLGAAFLIKQPAVVNVALFAAAVSAKALSEKREGTLAAVTRHNALLLLGFLIPLAASLVVFKRLGAAGKYLECVYLHNIKFYSQKSLGVALANFIINFKDFFIVALPVFAVSLVTPFLVRGDRRAHLCASWLALSFLGASIGLLFRNHYFLQLAPPLALFFAYGVQAAAKKFSVSKRTSYYAISGILLVPLILNNLNNYRITPEGLSKMYYGFNPFVESIKVAEYIKGRTAPEEKILVIGSEPQIYFYADRRSATRYIFFYPFFLINERALEMQKEAAEEITKNRPRFIVSVHMHFSLVIRQGSHLYIMEALNDLVRKDYRPVGCVFIQPDDLTPRYYLGDEFEEEKGRIPYLDDIVPRQGKPEIIIFERKR